MMGSMSATSFGTNLTRRFLFPVTHSSLPSGGVCGLGGRLE